jgi:chemotaxis protein MotA
MSDTARNEPVLPMGPGFDLRATDGRPDPVITISAPQSYLDILTLLGFSFSLLLIIAAVSMGNANAQFFDLPSTMIVILGTIFVTIVSYTARELRLAMPVIRGSLIRTVYDPKAVAQELLDIALLARKRGILSLSILSRELEKNPFLENAVQMVTDGMPAQDVDRLLNQDMDITSDAYRKAAGMMRRASEIAPAMGLIGTLVGLVQMLASLDNPTTIGPAMALALLTTFYGAVMGSVILAPLAAKLERNAAEDILVKSLVHAAMLSIIAQENPRKLEMELNSLLPPDLRISYFDV